MHTIYKRRALCALLLVGTYLFLLALAYGFPVTGDDWFFTARNQDFNH